MFGRVYVSLACGMRTLRGLLLGIQTDGNIYTLKVHNSLHIPQKRIAWYSEKRKLVLRRREGGRKRGREKNLQRAEYFSEEIKD